MQAAREGGWAVGAEGEREACEWIEGLMGECARPMSE